MGEPQRKILPGDTPLIINELQKGLPKVLQSAGYVTSAIGKWHLGTGKGNVNWNNPITPDANDIGLNNVNLIAATNDRVSTVFMENGKVVNLDASDSNLAKTNQEKFHQMETRFIQLTKRYYNPNVKEIELK